jgi:hypothetical protein
MILDRMWRCRVPDGMNRAGRIAATGFGRLLILYLVHPADPVRNSGRYGLRIEWFVIRLLHDFVT